MKDYQTPIERDENQLTAQSISGREFIYNGNRYLATNFNADHSFVWGVSLENNVGSMHHIEISICTLIEKEDISVDYSNLNKNERYKLSQIACESIASEQGVFKDASRAIINAALSEYDTLVMQKLD